MSSKTKTIVVRGRVDWAKLTGDARPYTGNPKFDKGPYWSVDITPDANSRKVIEDAGISDKLRLPKGEKDTRTESFLSLKVLKNKADGSPNLDRQGNQIVPKINSVDGRLWDDSLIGNGSVMDIKINVVDYGTTVGAYYQAGRVLSHVPYEGGTGWAPLTPDDEFFGGDKTEAADTPAKAQVNPDDLEDDVPF